MTTRTLGKPRQTQERIEQWLLARLEAGPQSSATLRQDAQGVGISFISLYRAAVRLEVQLTLERGHKGRVLSSSWSLPAERSAR